MRFVALIDTILSPIFEFKHGWMYDDDTYIDSLNWFDLGHLKVLELKCLGWI